jgi:hypothetical protein
MIKPFKVIQTRAEADGTTGVIYEVSQVTSLTATASTEKTMQAYMSIPQGRDVDEYLFEQLSKAGWF